MASYVYSLSTTISLIQSTEGLNLYVPAAGTFKIRPIHFTLSCDDSGDISTAVNTGFVRLNYSTSIGNPVGEGVISVYTKFDSTSPDARAYVASSYTTSSPGIITIAAFPIISLHGFQYDYDLTRFNFEMGPGQGIHITTSYHSSNYSGIGNGRFTIEWEEVT